MNALSHLLLGQHSPEQIVAFGGAGEKTAADLLADAAAVAAALPEPREADAQVLMVFRSDRYAFAAALLGVWARGYVATLPPNQRGETVAQLLAQPQIRALLHDTQVSGHIAVPALLGTRTTPPLPGVVLPKTVAAYSLTSGSTGNSEVWPKTTAQLLEEVSVLTRTFGLSPGLRSVVTVPPTHLYGLLFGVLLPLASGGAFLRDTPLLPEAVAARVREFNAQILISVPVHLRAAEALATGDLAKVTRVFSSTAPLHEATAQAFTQRHNLAITEIFGSTETGGIAWRERATFAHWRPLDGVTLSQDSEGRLCVASPFGVPGTDGPFVTSDRVELFGDGSFLHQGRDDGVVKVGGLRVSLPAMEDWLMHQAGVEDCVVVAVPEVARGYRVLCALSAPQLNEADLRDSMSAHFEPTTLPRRFLFLDRLPRETNGKLQRSRVLRLFGLAPDGKALSRELGLSPSSVAEDNPALVTASVTVPEDYVWYGGHFETYPVMAGVVQLHELILPLVQRHKPNWIAVRSLQRTKFLGRIAPGDVVSIDITFDASAPECSFLIRKKGRTCSSGNISFFRSEDALPSQGPAATSVSPTS